MTFQARHQVFAFNTLRNSLTRGHLHIYASNKIVHRDFTSRPTYRTPWHVNDCSRLPEGYSPDKEGKGRGGRERQRAKCSLSNTALFLFFFFSLSNILGHISFSKFPVYLRFFFFLSFFLSSSFFFQENAGSNKRNNEAIRWG